MSEPRWSTGEVVVRREVWRGKPWAAIPVRVVEDAEALALYLAAGTPLGFAKGDWPGGRHPWHGKERWRGHGVVMLHPPGEWHSIWAFWRRPGREFAGWYVNFQAPLRRRAHGVDTLDHEIDIWIPWQPDPAWAPPELAPGWERS